jgi:hypothetical protein
MGITRFSQIEMGFSTATGAASAVTGTGQHTIVTTEALATAALTNVAYTFNNKLIKVGSVVLAQVAGGTWTTGTPLVANTKVTGAGVATINLRNNDAAAALNGTLVLSVLVLNSTEK